MFEDCLKMRNNNATNVHLILPYSQVALLNNYLFSYMSVSTGSEMVFSCSEQGYRLFKLMLMLTLN